MNHDFTNIEKYANLRELCLGKSKNIRLIYTHSNVIYLTIFFFYLVDIVGNISFPIFVTWY